jgi:hypothetical protein
MSPGLAVTVKIKPAVARPRLVRFLLALRHLGWARKFFMPALRCPPMIRLEI